MNEQQTNCSPEIEIHHNSVERSSTIDKNDHQTKKILNQNIPSKICQDSANNIIDDSGLDMTKESLSTSQYVPKSANEKERLCLYESSDQSRYQSPQLIEEEASMEAQEDAYNVFQVRDTVEDSDEGLAGSLSFPSSEHLQSSIHGDKDDEVEAFSIDSTDVQIDCRNTHQIRTPLALQEDLVQDMLHIGGVQSITSSTVTSEIENDDVSSDSDYENLEEQKACVNEQQREEQEILTLQKSRGKKRAQSDTHDDADGHNKISSIFSIENAAGKVKSTALRIVKGAQRLSYFPDWLTQAFHVSAEEWDRKPTQAQLALLEDAILQSPFDIQLFIHLFQHVFGPYVCHDRQTDVMQSIHNLYILRGQPQSYPVKNGRFRSPAALELCQKDEFIYNYLSSFTNSSEFFNYDCWLQENFPESVLRSMHHRMARFFGKVSASGYEYWAYARAKYLDEFDGRAMRPEDLTVDERKEWIQELEECMSFQEATSITENVFGPLMDFEDIPAPKVDIEKYWSPCDCSICLRSNKRIKLDIAKNEFETLAMKKSL